MGSRLQTLLEQLNTLGMKDEYECYINTYVRKYCYPESKTDNCCTMQSDCVACKQTPDKTSTCNEASTSDNYGGLKKGFLSTKNNSEAQAEKKCSTQSQAESDRCNGASAKGADKPSQKDVDYSADCKPEISIEEKILDGVVFLREVVHSENDLKQFLDDFATQVAHLLAHNHANLPNLPTNRPPMYTDIIYFKENQFRDTLSLYCDVGHSMGLETPSIIVCRVLNNRELTILTLYMFEFATLYHEEKNESLEEKLASHGSIIQGYKSLLKRLEIDGYRASLEKFLKFLGGLSKNDHRDFTQLGQFDQIIKCKKLELTVMFKAILKYQDMYKNDEPRFYVFFSTHPIFKSITAMFDLIGIVTAQLS